MKEKRIYAVGFSPEGQTGIQEGSDGTTTVYTLPDYIQTHTKESGCPEVDTPVDHVREQQRFYTFVLAPRENGQKFWDLRRKVVSKSITERSISDEYEEEGVKHGRRELSSYVAVEDWQQPSITELAVLEGTYAVVTPFVIFVRSPKTAGKK